MPRLRISGAIPLLPVCLSGMHRGSLIIFTFTFTGVSCISTYTVRIFVHYICHIISGTWPLVYVAAHVDMHIRGGNGEWSQSQLYFAVI